MTNKPQLSSPSSSLATLLKQAATRLAEKGIVGQYTRHLVQSSDEVLVLLDVSGSMGELAGSSRKIDVLREALRYALHGGERLIAFATTPREIPAPASLPQPHGRTALHLALRAAKAYLPRHTLVVSDGWPDNEQAALEVATTLSGTIDVIYIGPDHDQKAIAFMRRLADVGHGRVHIHDIRRNAQARTALPGAIRAALPAPHQGP
jgi:hypothetical protein